MNIATRLFLVFLGLSGTLQLLASPTGDRPLCVNITSIVIQPENCNQQNGSITVNHDGTAPFTYQWTGTVSNTNTANGLAAGNYTLKIFDSAGCDAETTLVVTETQAPLLTVDSTRAGGCAGGGFAWVTSSDPTASAVWNSNPPQQGFILQDAPPGNYILTATDSVGCAASVGISLASPLSFTVSTSTTADTCGSADGTATVVADAVGQAPFTYQWDANAGNQTTATARDLPAGTYQVTVTDARGCIASTDATVDLESNLTILADITEATCYQGEDASVRLSVSGGNGNYGFDWQPNVSSSNQASGLTAGTYQVTVRDGEGSECTVTQVVEVGERPQIDLNFDERDPSDCGVNDGAAWVTPTNVQGPYSVRWDSLGVGTSFASGDTADNLYPGVYFVFVTDSAGCSNQQRFILESQDNITVEVDIQQEDDCGLGEGIARATVSGGRRPFRYQWFTFPITQDTASPFAYNLEQGFFFVVVSDQDDCVNVDFFTMPGRPPLEVTGSLAGPEYCDLANGTARVSFEGGTPPYNYQWNTVPVQTTASATGLTAGRYRVAITDQRNCRDTATVFVESEAGFDISAEATPVSCFGEEDGTANVSIQNGGIAPFQIEWNSDPVQTSNTATNLPAGEYLVTVTDAGGCQRSTFAVVGDQEPLEAAFSFSPDTARPVTLARATFAFNNLSRGAEHFAWNFGDGNTSEEKSPIYTYKDTGHFFVTLRVYNNDKLCFDEVAYGPFIVIEPGTAFIPTAFTPNSDGINDLLEFGGVFLESFDFRLYDRWGRRIWMASSVNDKWNGTLPNGGSAPEGVYVFTMRAVGIDGVLLEDQGTITLIR